jgi:hypothetical protein
MTDFDEPNRQQLQYLRHELNPHFTVDVTPPTPPYVELWRVDWSEHGGNVIVVVPMGYESYRTRTP